MSVTMRTCERCRADYDANTVRARLGRGRYVCGPCYAEWEMGGRDDAIDRWIALGAEGPGPEPLAPVLDRLDVLLGGGQEALTILQRIARALDEQTDFMKGATDGRR